MARTTQDRSANVLCAFYTHSDPIRNYMVSRLDLRDSLSVLEPAVGDGAFVDALRETPFALDICCVDKNAGAIKKLHTRFGGEVRVLCADTILDSWNGEGNRYLRAGFPEKFDRVVGNPPYGGWLDYETRTALKKTFPDFHVRETYGLFILRCLDLLKNDGILSFIVPDTFLSVAAHRRLRELLLKRTALLEIVTLPSKLFPGVAFGYSDLCIITLRKPHTSAVNNHQFKIINVRTANELLALARGETAGSCIAVSQSSILQRPDFRIWTTNEHGVESILHSAKLHLGDIAECKTGIYTGDNKQFIRALAGSSGRTGYYQTVESSNVITDPLAENEKANGIPISPAWIPIVKGGSHRYIQMTSWLLDWSASAMSFYRSNAKARFQNSQFYFRDGIGVPMVTSTRINAFLIQRRVFDQSVVGIFPKRREWMLPLLLILNCSFATKLLKEGINPTANNSANYLKKLPLPKLNPKELRHLGALARLIVRKKVLGLPTDAEETIADQQVAALYHREELVTNQDTWSDFARSDGDTPLFPCLRETPHSYGSKLRGRIQSPRE